MMKGGHGQTNQLHDIIWGTLDHASHASQIMSCNYYLCAWCGMCVHMCVYVCVSVKGRGEQHSLYLHVSSTLTCESSLRPPSGQFLLPPPPGELEVVCTCAPAPVVAVAPAMWAPESISFFFIGWELVDRGFL